MLIKEENVLRFETSLIPERSKMIERSSTKKVKRAYYGSLIQTT